MSDSGKSSSRKSAARPAGLRLPLETPRLRIREFLSGDLSALCDVTCDPRVTRYLFYGPRDPAEAQRYLTRIIGAQGKRPRSSWELAVEDRGSGRLIGACELTLVAAGEADLGYMLHPDSWGSGYATETAGVLRDAGFRSLKIERIISTVDVRNAASIRVLEKAGFSWEATYRKLKQARGSWRDCHLYVLSRPAWEVLAPDAG